MAEGEVGYRWLLETRNGRLGNLNIGAYACVPYSMEDLVAVSVVSAG